MPRITAEARGAAAFRSGSKPPAAPTGFTDVEAKLWREIVSQKPIGWFDAGSLPLLGQYCRTLARAQLVGASLATVAVDDPAGIAFEKRLTKLNANCATLATKLRLSVQNNVDRRSRMLDETVQPSGEADAGLLGGSAVWGGGPAVN